jgi:hypothetical protein
MEWDDWLWTAGLLVLALVTYFPLRAITAVGGLKMDAAATYII